LNGQSRTQDAREALQKALDNKAPFDERADAEKLRSKIAP
jgi:hypothetical protein